MDYLQYWNGWELIGCLYNVLNLIINGLPSIPERVSIEEPQEDGVLNLIINGLPSIQFHTDSLEYRYRVLNLIINGLPSILS